HMNIRPVQKPRPPIWMAANSDPAVKRTARMADTWMINPHATIDTIRRQMAIYRAELKALGKGAPRELPVAKEVYCAKDRATALEMAGPYLLAKYRDYAKWGQDKVMPDDTDFNRPLEELIKQRFILGSPEDCYDGLKPYWEEFGVNHIIIRTHWVAMPLSTSLASMRLISDELLPALQGVSPWVRLWLRASLSILAAAPDSPFGPSLMRCARLKRSRASSAGSADDKIKKLKALIADPAATDDERAAAREKIAAITHSARSM